MFVLLRFFLTASILLIRVPTCGSHRLDSRMKQVLLNATDAKCMDGSPPVYYWRQGHGEGKHKWIIILAGGGWCYDEDQCYARAHGPLGSSMKYGPHITLPMYMSPKSVENPQMYNWNTVYVAYCDGSTFAGDSSIQIKDKLLHFKGKACRDAVIQDLLVARPPDPASTTQEDRPTLATATDVVLGGVSAGALAVLLGIDEIAATIRSVARVRGHNGQNITIRGLLDSGFFFDFRGDKMVSSGNPLPDHSMQPHEPKRTPAMGKVSNKTAHLNFGSAMRQMFVTTNSSAGANWGCLQAHLRQPNSLGTPAEADCIFADILVPFVQTPVFFVQSRYDTYQILNVYDQMYSTEGVNHFGAEMLERLKSAIFGASNNQKTATRGKNHVKHGAFVDSCTRHGIFGCRGGLHNWWSGGIVRSTHTTLLNYLNNSTAVRIGHAAERAGDNGSDFLAAEKGDRNVLGIDSRGVDGSEGYTPAQAFERWYAYAQSGEALAEGPVETLNWYLQDRPFPCYECCTCSPDLKATPHTGKSKPSSSVTSPAHVPA